MIEISEIKFILNVLALSAVFCITLIIGYCLFRVIISLLEKLQNIISVKKLELKREKLIKGLSEAELNSIKDRIDEKCESCIYFCTGSSDPSFSISGKCQKFKIPTMFSDVCDSFKSSPNNIKAALSNFRPFYNKPSSDTFENLFKDCKMLNDSDEENNTEEE